MAAVNNNVTQAQIDAQIRQNAMLVQMQQLQADAASRTLDMNREKSVMDAQMQAIKSVETNNKIAAIGMWASTQTALLKVKTDMNDAMNSFIKGVGSSIKSAAQ